jgi:hypothetical protein
MDLEMGRLSCTILVDPISSHESLKVGKLSWQKRQSDANQNQDRFQVWKELNIQLLALKINRGNYELRNAGDSKY